MARPKSTFTKEQINLTINREVLKTIKGIAKINGKSLSQLTEDCYRDIIQKFEALQNNPDEVLKMVQDQVEKIVQERLKQGEQKHNQ